MASTTAQQSSTDIARWDPFEDMELLQQQLASLVPGLPRMTPGWSRGNGEFRSEFIPSADVEETDDAYLVEIELPGVKKEDIEVELSGRRLTVKGERKERERKGTLRRRARTVGRFRYELILPSDLDDTAAESSLKDGVLSVRIPKHAEERPKRISVS